jgi:hypothetical protein
MKSIFPKRLCRQILLSLLPACPFEFIQAIVAVSDPYQARAETEKKKNCKSAVTSAGYQQDVALNKVS